jgi:hypothetical protein
VAKTKDREKVEVVKINSIDEETDEVFLYRDSPGLPYINEAIRVPSGTCKLGAYTEDTIEKKQELAEEKKK